MAVLGIDLGEKRVGIAISRSRLLAERYALLEFSKNILKDPAGFEDLVTRLRAILRREEVDLLVVGLPLLADGSLSEFAKKIKNLAQKLGFLLGVKVEFENEAYSSEPGTSDDEAARLILEQYLNSKRRK